MSYHIVVLAGLQRIFLALLLTLLPAWATGEEVQPPAAQEPSRGIARVSDPHIMLHHEERSALEQTLADFWSRTGLKISVLIDSPSNPWESLEAFTVRTAKRWELVGTTDHPGGILMVVDPQTQRAAMSVSSELMADFPSGSLERIIKGNVNPMLIQGAMAGGITEGVKRTAAFLEHPDRVNRSLFERGYGTLAAFTLFLIGAMLRRKWGVLRSAIAAALCFGGVVVFDGLNIGFSWFEALSIALFSAPFLGLFVWVGMGNDLAMEPNKPSGAPR